MQIGSINDTLSAQLGRNQFSSMESLVLITQRLIECMQDERRDDAVNYSRADLYETNQKKAKLLSFKARIADNVAAAAKAKSAIEWTTRILGEMKTELQTILGSSDSAARAAAAASFEAHLADINSRVDGASHRIDSRVINLVGATSGPGFETDDLFSPSSASGGHVMIEGAYIGTRVNIEDADGYL